MEEQYEFTSEKWSLRAVAAASAERPAPDADVSANSKPAGKSAAAAKTNKRRKKYRGHGWSRKPKKRPSKPPASQTTGKSKKKNAKFYVVVDGWRRGIWTEWEQARAQVSANNFCLQLLGSLLSCITVLVIN